MSRSGRTVRDLCLRIACVLLLAAPAIAFEAPFEAQPADSALLTRLLHAHAEDPSLAPVLANPQRFDVQILWTRLSKDGRRVQARHGWRLDGTRWFSPASTVKLPLAILTLEELAATGLPRSAKMAVTYPTGCTPASASGVPTPDLEPIERTLRRMLVVSDNEAANRLYQWFGGAHAQLRMGQLGLPDARIIRPLMVCTDAARQRLGQVRITAPKRKAVSIPERSAGARPPFPYGAVLRGQAWLEDGVLSQGPRDFSDSNFLSLSAAEQLLAMVVQPEIVPQQQRGSMREADRLWLREVLATTPQQNSDPVYAPKAYPANYAKFFLVGDDAEWPKGVRIYNKIGEAYGYLTDIAYVENVESGVHFFLAATISVDLDGTLNDGQYAYREIGYPFLAALGRVIYRFELAASRRN